MNTRKTGEVYTPAYVVDYILDLVQYNSNKILNKHVIDNSCGKGAFLLSVVDRYIEVAIKNNMNESKIIEHLETYIHGIELNENSYLETLDNLNNLVKEKGITKKIKWDILNDDALNVNKFDNQMDFVVGNPPYIRVHDLDFDYKKFEFSRRGMTDLYIIFFEIGIKMLSNNGKLAYITPRSFTTSATGVFLRKHFIEHNLLEKIMDFKHENPFKNITTYPIVSVLNKNKKNNDLEVYDSKLENKFIIKDNNYYINNNFFFVKPKDIFFLREVFENKKFNSNIFVRNGLATNADWFFYDNEYTGKYVVDAIKASTGSKIKLFLPYKTSSIINIKEIKQQNKSIYDKLSENKEDLQKRSLEKTNHWYGFARSQALNDIDKDKLAISTIIKDIETIKINYAHSNVAVYAGLYIYSPAHSLEDIKNEILSERFIRYVKLLNKLKSGEYYTFTSRDLNIYLNYAFSKKEGN